LFDDDQRIRLDVTLARRLSANVSPATVSHDDVSASSSAKLSMLRHACPYDTSPIGFRASSTAVGMPAALVSRPGDLDRNLIGDLRAMLASLAPDGVTSGTSSVR
jgi:hypothetical protein